MQSQELSKLIHNLSFKQEERVDLFRALSPETQAQVMLRLTKHIQYEILTHLNKDEVVKILEHLDPDEATDLIQLLPKRRQDELTRILTEELKRDISTLLKFDPETAGGLMDMDYIQVDDSDTISQVAKQFKVHEKRTGRLPAIIVMKEGRISGYLPGHELGFAKPGEKARKYIRHIQTIKHSAGHEEVVELFRAHPHNKVAVLGEQNNVIGVLYSDDILRFLHEQESKSLYEFAGVSEEENVLDSTSRKVKSRYKWLIINLATAFLAALTVGLFDETISKYVLLAVYMPIVAGMGGNAATQTLAVLVRGITLRQISLSNAWETLKREILSGLFNGLINGIIVAGVVLAVNQDIKLAIILAVAMIINLMVAGFFGTITPLVMQKLGKDPASSATVFITTATDVLGFLVFLGLAAMFLI